MSTPAGGTLTAVVERLLEGEGHTPAEPTGERILDAAVAEIGDAGLDRLTMPAVAKRAGVTRVTVYRYFANRDRLVEAVATREVQRVLMAIAEAAMSVDDPEERLVAAFVTGLKIARRHPIIGRAARLEPQRLVAALQAGDSRLMRLGIGYLVGLMKATDMRVRTDYEHIADTVGRLFSSFLVLPSITFDMDDDAAVRAYARAVIVPLMLGAEPRR